MEIGYSPKIKAINHGQLQYLDPTPLNKSCGGLKLHTTCNSEKWQGKATTHALPCHITFVSQPLIMPEELALCQSCSLKAYHTRDWVPSHGVWWRTLIDFCVPPYNERVWEGHSPHICHSSYTNEFPQCSTGRPLWCCFAIHLYWRDGDITIYHWNKIVIRAKESTVTIYTWITVLSLLIQDMRSHQTHYLSEDKISQWKAWNPGRHRSTLKILSMKIVWGLCLCVCVLWRPMESKINLPKGPTYGRLKQFIFSCNKGQNCNQEADSDSI